MEVNNIVLIDLCARLPYRVNVEHNGEVKSIARYDTRERFELTDGTIASYVNLKPYLRPMSSMTDGEQKELEKIIDGILGYNAKNYFHSEDEYNWETLYNACDWLNAHHFDYRGLIEKGLALEAPEGMCK